MKSIGIDIGTTTIAMLLYHEDGSVSASSL